MEENSQEINSAIIPKIRLCDEVAEFLKNCDGPFVAQIAKEVAKHISNKEPIIDYIGGDSFYIKLK